MAQSVSVIIPTVGEETLEQTLLAIIPQVSELDEIIVVGTYSDELPGRFSNVKFISTHKCTIAGAARNLGMKIAKGDIFLFTDSDCIPDKNWISGHRYYQNQNQQIVGGGVDLNHHNFLSLADNISMFHEFSTAQLPSKKDRLPSCNLSVHRSVWTTLGGFDETFPRGEDSDWTFRMSQRGYQLFFYPNISIRHLTVRTSLNAVLDHWLQSGKWNVHVRRKYLKEYKHPHWLYSNWLLILLSPIISVWVTLKIFSQKRFFKYWATSPLVYFTKIFYCWGAATQPTGK